jgi:hypothetical protein
MHKKFCFIAIILSLCLVAPAAAKKCANVYTSPANPADVDSGNIDHSQPTGITVDEIIQKFAAKEKEFAQARENYTYRQDVKMDTLDGNTPTGEYREVFDVQFSDAGKRLENVVFAPQNTLEAVQLDPEDLQDIRHRYPFVLTSDDLPNYQIMYVGKEHVDELDTYVFDITPKKLEKNQRYFEGRVWVDQQDLQIVKSYGKPAYLKTKQNEEHLYPAFSTYREQVDGKYWFPTYTKSDENLHFCESDVHLKIVVKYQDYQRFGAKSRIIFEGKDIGKDNNSQPPKQEPATAPPK